MRLVAGHCHDLEIRVSIPAPARDATFIKSIFKYNFFMFQSPRPRGMRRMDRNYGFIENMFQSPRPRGMRREMLGYRAVAKHVSIPAPARDATKKADVGKKPVS